MVHLCTTLLSALALGSQGRPLQVSKASLRQVSANAPAAAVVAAPAAAAPAAAATVAPTVVAAVAPAVGLCGCAPPTSNECTCGASLRYLKCVAVKCASNAHLNVTGCQCPEHPYAQECTSVVATCGHELEVGGCFSKTTTCEGKFSQEVDGVVGLTLNTTRLLANAYCGPYSRCTGEVTMVANIYRPAAGAWLQCEMPSTKKSRFAHCNAAIATTGGAECTLPMVPLLDPADSVKGHCYLTHGKNGTRLTKDAWFLVRNRYEAK